MNTEALDKAMFNICKNSNDINKVSEEIENLTSDEVESLQRFTAMIDNLLMDRDLSFYNPRKEI